jgi:hypothetical protein
MIQRQRISVRHCTACTVRTSAAVAPMAARLAGGVEVAEPPQKATPIAATAANIAIRILSSGIFDCSSATDYRRHGFVTSVDHDGRPWLGEHCGRLFAAGVRCQPKEAPDLSVGGGGRAFDREPRRLPRAPSP